jgi:hypothetical protein
MFWSNVIGWKCTWGGLGQENLLFLKHILYYFGGNIYLFKEYIKWIFDRRPLNNFWSISKENNVSKKLLLSYIYICLNEKFFIHMFFVKSHEWNWCGVEMAQMTDIMGIILSRIFLII